MVSVLIVEGDEDLRYALAGLVHDHGFEVTAAPDGVTALHLLRSAPLPALVLLDTHLPRLSGLSVLTAIRADPKLATVRVVSMSTDPATRPEAVAAHVRLPEEVPRLAAVLLGLCSAEYPGAKAAPAPPAEPSGPHPGPCDRS